MYISCYFPALFFLLVVFLILEPLGVDFELPRGPSHLQKPSFCVVSLHIFEKRRFTSKNCFGCVLALSWTPFGGSRGSLGVSLGPLDRPRGASIFVLELPWASFARFLLPKMVLRAFWGRIWLVFRAPECLLRGCVGIRPAEFDHQYCASEF